MAGGPALVDREHGVAALGGDPRGVIEAPAPPPPGPAGDVGPQRRRGARRACRWLGRLETGNGLAYAFYVWVGLALPLWWAATQA